MKKLVVCLTLVIAIFVVVYIISITFKPFLSNKTHLVYAENFQPILIDNEHKIYFFKDGFILAGQNPLFYEWSGLPMEPPFNQDDLKQDILEITHYTNNYILANNGRIFNISNNPFELVYENEDINIIEMKEYADFLLIMVKDTDDSVLPYLLVAGSNFLISLDGMGNSHFLYADAHANSKGLSLLTISIDTPVPVSKVFHFSNRNSIYGLLSLDDILLYDLYRLREHVVLVCNNEIICYNINGGKEWAVNKARNAAYQSVKHNDSLLIYFKDTAIDNNSPSNALSVNKDGDLKLMLFPKYITNLQSYEGGYIGLEYNNTIITMDKQGKVISRNRLPEKIKWFTTTVFQPDTVVILTNDNVIKTYTNNMRKD